MYIWENIAVTNEADIRAHEDSEFFLYTIYEYQNFNEKNDPI